MALKALMLKRSIDKKKGELKILREKDHEFEQRELELEAAIEEAATAEDEAAVSEEIEKFETERSVHEESKINLETEIGKLEEELENLERKQPEPQNRSTEKTTTIERRKEMPELNIRSLPGNVRAFDALPMETREAILKREEVKRFLEQLREMKGSKRAISGAELEIPVVFLDLISQNTYRYSKLMNRVRTRTVRGEARQTIAGTVPEAVWTEMCGAINELSFVFNQITLDGFKVAGFVPVCNSILEDTDIELSSWIVEMISEAIGLAKDKAILYGKGSSSKMPMGIVTRLAQATRPSDYPANAPAWENLSTTHLISINGNNLNGAEFWSKMAEATGNTYTRYNRGTQFWAMNSKTYAKLRSKLITFTANGDIVANLFGTLPIVNGDIDILEFIPDNDIIGGYGDLYLWVERGSMVIDLSTEVQFINDNTVFRGKERADGAPIIPGAFVAINIANATPTTVVDFAADTANDADLNALSVGGNTLAPEFDSGITTYTIATASADTAKVEATTAQARAMVDISYNGKNVRNGGTIALLKDGVAHPLTITVRNGNAVKVYTVNITRASA